MQLPTVVVRRVVLLAEQDDVARCGIVQDG
jgi:hypothetical protein